MNNLFLIDFLSKVGTTFEDKQNNSIKVLKLCKILIVDFESVSALIQQIQVYLYICHQQFLIGQMLLILELGNKTIGWLFS